MKTPCMILLLLFVIGFILWMIPLLIGRRKLIKKGIQETLLTFDDGPSEVTEELLKVLDQCQCRACFFLLGEEIVKRREVVQKILNHGHAVGIHGYSHKHPLKMFFWDQKKDLERAYQVFLSQGIPVSYYRAPHGAYTWASLLFCKKHDLDIVHWTGLVGDWKLEQEETLLQRLLDLSGPGHILVLHDGSKGTANPLCKMRIPHLVLRLHEALKDTSAPLGRWEE